VFTRLVFAEALNGKAVLKADLTMKTTESAACASTARSYRNGGS
jgi:hypothetical protein